MTLKAYCDYLGWNANVLAEQAKINDRTARKALAGQVISSRAARKIAAALSVAMERKIFPGDIQGLAFV